MFIFIFHNNQHHNGLSFFFLLLISHMVSFSSNSVSLLYFHSLSSRDLKVENEIRLIRVFLGVTVIVFLLLLPPADGGAVPPRRGRTFLEPQQPQHRSPGVSHVCVAHHRGRSAGAGSQPLLCVVLLQAAVQGGPPQ